MNLVTNELRADIELHTPAWLPGGKLAIHYRRLWDKRADRLVSEVSEVANVDEQTLLERIEEGDGFAEVFQNAGGRMIEDCDPGLHDVFTRLIAAALDDDARIHEVSYMLTKLESLQPIHVRLIARIPIHAGSSSEDGGLAQEVNASTFLVRSACRELRNNALLAQDAGGTSLYRIDELGIALRDLIDKFRQ